MLPSETFTPTETPTETATATFTETPSETPTETPTPAAEVTAEAEFTVEVTAEPEITAEITETPTSIPEATVAPTRTAPPPPQVLTSGPQLLLSCDPNDLIIVPAGDETALLAAIAVVNSCPSIHYTIYVRPTEDMIFVMDIVPNSPISISGDVTIYANNAIIRSNYSGPSTSTGYSLITVNSGAIAKFHHVIIENGYNWAIGYGGGITNYGLLSIYDSTLHSNRADNGGGGILNWGTLRIERTLFQTNAADGGGAIRNINTFGGNGTITCSRFTTNGAFFGGAILGEGTFTGSLSIVAPDNTFDGNNASISDDIHNIASGPPVLAQNNYWGADGVADVNATVDASSPLNYDPTIENSSEFYTRPECRPIAPRIVADEAIRFHLSAKKFGLSIPFVSLPYNVNQLNQTPDPLRLGETEPRRRINSQGYGPSAFTYEDYYYTDNQGDDSINSLYDGTLQLHPGLDYGNGNVRWDRRVVISICDGVVIQGRDQTSPQSGSRDNGGSAGPGRGVSVRCFMDSLDNGRSDTDGDGIPNLSNAVVVYNHLLWRMNPDDPPNYNNVLPHGPYYIDCALVSLDLGCGGSLNVYQLPRFRYPGSGDVIGVNDIRVGDVVRVGTVLGQTGSKNADGSGPDHLHLEIWLARGYLKAAQAGNSETNHAININPFLSYTPDVIAQHRLQDYFPTPLNLPVVDNLGISDGDLSVWSLGGLNFVYGSNKFYNSQIATQNGVEWPHGSYPLVTVLPLSIADLIGFLEVEYTQRPYVPINCPITMDPDTTRIPQTEIASCAMPDLQDHILVNP